MLTEQAIPERADSCNNPYLCSDMPAQQALLPPLCQCRIKLWCCGFWTGWWAALTDGRMTPYVS
jgi:hypothetical protein